MCLGGTATVHTDKHSDTCSGYFVWIDLVEAFLKRSGARRTQVHEELEAVEWKGPRAENLQQFFKRFNQIVVKFRAVGGQLDESTVVSKLSRLFVHHSSLYYHVIALLTDTKASEDSSRWQTLLIQRLQLDRAANRAHQRANSHLAQGAQPYHHRIWKNPTYNRSARPQNRTTAAQATPHVTHNRKWIRNAANASAFGHKAPVSATTRAHCGTQRPAPIRNKLSPNSPRTMKRRKGPSTTSSPK